MLLDEVKTQKQKRNPWIRAKQIRNNIPLKGTWYSFENNGACHSYTLYYNGEVVDHVSGFATYDDALSTARIEKKVWMQNHK